MADPGGDSVGGPVTPSGGQPPADQPHCGPPALTVLPDQGTPRVPVTGPSQVVEVPGTHLARGDTHQPRPGEQLKLSRSEKFLSNIDKL